VATLARRSLVAAGTSSSRPSAMGTDVTGR
jgi:hypothetical protein